MAPGLRVDEDDAAYDWKADEEAWERAFRSQVRKRFLLSKHPGPGGSPLHSTGTTQQVHNPNAEFSAEGLETITDFWKAFQEMFPEARVEGSESAGVQIIDDEHKVTFYLPRWDREIYGPIAEALHMFRANESLFHVFAETTKNHPNANRMIFSFDAIERGIKKKVVGRFTPSLWMIQVTPYKWTVVGKELVNDYDTPRSPEAIYKTMAHEVGHAVSYAAGGSGYGRGKAYDQRGLDELRPVLDGLRQSVLFADTLSLGLRKRWRYPAVSMFKGGTSNGASELFAEAFAILMTDKRGVQKLKSLPKALRRNVWGFPSEEDLPDDVLIEWIRDALPSMKVEKREDAEVDEPDLQGDLPPVDWPWPEGAPVEEVLQVWNQLSKHPGPDGSEVHSTGTGQKVHDPHGGGQEVVPPEPGTTPIPEGYVRLYHYTQEKGVVDQIAREGIRLDRSRGETYGEPNLVWLSARMPKRDVKEFVEVALPMKWVREHALVGTPGDESPDEWMARGSDVGLGVDVPASSIISVYKPWHDAYRYIMNDEHMRSDMTKPESEFLDNYGDLLDDPRYGPALRLARKRLLGEVSKHPGPGGSEIHSTGTTQQVHDPNSGGGGGQAEPEHHKKIPWKIHGRFRKWWNKTPMVAQVRERTDKGLKEVTERMKRDPRWAEAEAQLDRLTSEKEVVDFWKKHWAERIEKYRPILMEDWGVDIDDLPTIDGWNNDFGDFLIFEEEGVDASEVISWSNDDLLSEGDDDFIPIETAAREKLGFLTTEERHMPGEPWDILIPIAQDEADKRLVRVFNETTGEEETRYINSLVRDTPWNRREMDRIFFITDPADRGMLREEFRELVRNNLYEAKDYDGTGGVSIMSVIRDYSDFGIVDVLYGDSYEAQQRREEDDTLIVNDTYNGSGTHIIGKDNFVWGMRNLWANTAMDEHKWAVALQKAVREEFNLESDPVVNLHPDVEADAEHLMNEYGTMLRVYARAVYDETQDFLRKNSDKLVLGQFLPLWRGMKDVNLLLGNDWTETYVETNPISSWSADSEIARDFAGRYGDGVIMRDMIPAEHVWGMSQLGFGSYREQEVIVLGGEERLVEAKVRQ